jgi:hypothetical protein
MSQDPKAPPSQAQAREARLQQALRANLRRRKAPDLKPDPKQDPDRG